MHIETEDEFFERAYWNGKYWLVWQTKKLKDSKTIFKPKAERWDMQTFRNYMDYLENETDKS